MICSGTIFPKSIGEAEDQEAAVEEAGEALPARENNKGN
jgi:hypothetical protein